MTNPASEAKINDIHSWWEVPCIAHFCSLFRASFNLIDFDIEDLEEALLTDDASDSGNTLIQELIVRLLRGYYGNNSISTFNYQMFLRRLFRQKCREFNCYNPFDNDMDFQFLPMRTKVEILHMLCDFRLDADDVLEILKDLDSDSLRVHPLGFDANKSAYWYFYGTRLYREDYPKKKKVKEKKRGRKRKRGRNKEEESNEDDDEAVELGSGVWQVVCFTESDWERLAVNTEEATDKNEQALHQIIEEDFLPEIPKLFQEKERLQRKRFLELHPRKSSRIESLKRRKEQEKKYIDQYQRTLEMDESESEADSELSSKKARNARYERWKNRNNHKGNDSCYSDDDATDCDSIQDSINSDMTRNSSLIVGRGRQTNNSLSTAAGEMLLQPVDRCSPEWFDTKLEDLHNGMYKVLNKLKEHEDSWPFLEPVDEEDAPHYYEVVKTPMNLQRMEDKLDSGKYKSLSEFKYDFKLILDNCAQYNGSQNEYTRMGENLEKVFNSCIKRFIPVTDSSDVEGIDESNEFLDSNSSSRKRKRKRKRKMSSKSAEDADKENEQKLSDAAYSINSVESDRNTDDTLSIETRLEHFPFKRGKGRPPKNASALHALDIVTEQALRDVIKLLDDAPKCNEYRSPSVSPPPPLLSPNNSEPVADNSSETTEIVAPPKTTKPSRPKNPAKQRPSKENHHKHLQLIKQRRRDVQRTIDRLQPGKSKGNLISTIGKSQPNRPSGAEEASTSREPRTKNENLPRVKPMLSLGSVLSTDIINLDTSEKKHTFSDNDSVPSDEEDLLSDNDDTNNDANELQAENLALDKNSTERQHTAVIHVDEKKPETTKSVDNFTKPENSNNSCDSITKTASNAPEKTDKRKPNLGAWFKAFGAPKTQPTLKKKSESQFNENPATPLVNHDGREDDTRTCVKPSDKFDEERFDAHDLPPPTPGRFFLYEDDRDQKNGMPSSLTSPEMRPMKRQRKLSTGSSVSERSSFSQDPNDPMNSPHPSLDDPVYQSPQHYQPPISSTGMKVGFYQDAFQKGGSDKSNSCSPREPLNSVSPQHPMFSPRDSITSPRDSTCSPRGPLASPSPREHNNMSHSSPRSTVPSPRYAAVSPRDAYNEPLNASQYQVKSPVYSAPQVDHDANARIYKSAAPQPVHEKTFIYPVKKRISAELEQSTRQLNEQQQQQQQLHHQQQQQQQQHHHHHLPPHSLPSQQQLERTREAFNSEPERHYLPQHILPPPPTAYPSEPSSIPMSLSHHSHHPTYMDSYPPPPESMIMNPYFQKDLYVSSQGITPPVSSQNSSLFASQSNESQTRYAPPRQSSPLVSSAYARSPLDFAAATSSPLSLTNKTNESYTSQYHHKYVVPPESALNFSAKSSQHPFYPVQPDRKLNVDPQALPSYDSRTTNVYHATPPASHASYPSGAGPYSNAHVDYFSGNKPGSYQIYPNYGAPTRDEKQYYQTPQPKPQSTEGGYVDQTRVNYEQPKISENTVDVASSSVAHYEASYQNLPPAKPPKKSKRRKSTVNTEAPQPAENPSMYPHYVGGAQGAVPAPTPQDLKHHNGIMSSSAFNFNPPASLKSDYQQYFDTLRNSRYFAESAAAAVVTNEKTPPVTASSANNFSFLQRGARSPFSLAAQAFPPCPPSIYSSPYLPRPTDELLRPMMLQQGLMSHAGGYPSGYLNMHDPINRSPWL